MKRFWSLSMHVLLALNMFVLHLITDQSDLIISGWSYIRVRQGKRSPIKFIDWLFLKLNKQEDHCRKAFEWELSEARKFYHEHRPYLKEVI
ncbi:hypothetical protein BT049_RS03220 [Vibrio parahaemolyticus]|nr:hypothetical protein [Vibrio parahaemolyticus]ELA7161100.1 hypothetical protein [Vibrio parahaemolyticus]MDG2998376.1 hypothetical protein [Vibrio parahaemolyticus]MDG3036327.1 hypothetical protein [Vibrio parahaemolyticus]